MGCSPSGGTMRQSYGGAKGAHGGDGAFAAQAVLERYLRLERDLWREEKTAPAPALHHSATRLDAAVAALVAARQRLGATAAAVPVAPPHQQPSSQHPPSREHMQLSAHATPPVHEAASFYNLEDQVPETSTSLQDVLLDLKIDRNPTRAAEHEEFIANINRQELARNEVTLLERRSEEAEEEVKIATAKVNYLQGLYQQQDQLLGEVFGEQYGSADERRLELKLDRLRSFRDTLAGGELEWREAHALASIAADDMRHAVAAWERLASTPDPETRTRQLLETRENAQAAAAAAAAAHAALPGAGLPACTPRELAAVAHALVYIFTDAQDADKAAHAGRLYRHFWLRACELADWIRKTMADTLQKDLTDVDLQVAEATAELREIRIQLIRQKLGFMGPLPGVDERLQGKVFGPPFGAGLNAPFPANTLAGMADDPALVGKGRRRLEHSALFAGSGGRALYGPQHPRHPPGPAAVATADDVPDSPDALRRELAAAKLKTPSGTRWPGSKGMERRHWASSQ